MSVAGALAHSGGLISSTFLDASPDQTANPPLANKAANEITRNRYRTPINRFRVVTWIGSVPRECPAFAFPLQKSCPQEMDCQFFPCRWISVNVHIRIDSQIQVALASWDRAFQAFETTKDVQERPDYFPT